METYCILYFSLAMFYMQSFYLEFREHPKHLQFIQSWETVLSVNYIILVPLACQLYAGTWGGICDFSEGKLIYKREFLACCWFSRRISNYHNNPGRRGVSGGWAGLIKIPQKTLLKNWTKTLSLKKNTTINRAYKNNHGKLEWIINWFFFLQINAIHFHNLAWFLQWTFSIVLSVMSVMFSILFLFSFIKNVMSWSQFTMGPSSPFGSTFGSLTLNTDNEVKEGGIISALTINKGKRLST